MAVTTVVILNSRPARKGKCKKGQLEGGIDTSCIPTLATHNPSKFKWPVLNSPEFFNFEYFDK